MDLNFNIETPMIHIISMQFKATQVKVNKAYKITSNINSFKKNFKEEKVIIRKLQVGLKWLWLH